MAGALTEPSEAREDVIVVLGGNMKPADVRCRANIAANPTDENGDPEVDEIGQVVYADEVRCENEISYDPVSDGWSQFCQEHTDKTNEARAGGSQGPVKVSQELIDADLKVLESEVGE